MALKLATTLENKVRGEYWKIVDFLYSSKTKNVRVMLGLFVDAQAASSTNYAGTVDMRVLYFNWPKTVVSYADIYAKIKTDIEEFNRAEDV